MNSALKSGKNKVRLSISDLVFITILLKNQRSLSFQILMFDLEIWKTKTCTWKGFWMASPQMLSLELFASPVFKMEKRPKNFLCWNYFHGLQLCRIPFSGFVYRIYEYEQINFLNSIQFPSELHNTYFLFGKSPCYNRLARLISSEILTISRPLFCSMNNIE